MRFSEYKQLVERVAPNHYYVVKKAFKAQRLNGDAYEVLPDDELHYLYGGTYIIRGNRLVKVRLDAPAQDTVQFLVDRGFVGEIQKRDAQAIKYEKTA